MHKNKFKYEPIDMRKPNLWMHSIDRVDTNGNGQVWSSFGILIAMIALVFCILWAASELPKAYPSNPIVKK